MKFHRKLDLRVPPPPPQPAVLTVHHDSHKIQKTPSPSSASKRKPVVIYVVSPEIIHVDASEFMPLVQRLTGPDAPPPGSGRPERVKVRDDINLNPSIIDVVAGDGQLLHDDHKNEEDRRGAASPTIYFHDLSPQAATSLRKDGTIGGSAAAADHHGSSWLMMNGDRDEYMDQHPSRSSSDDDGDHHHHHHHRFHSSSSGSGFSSSFLDIFSHVPHH